MPERHANVERRLAGLLARAETQGLRRLKPEELRALGRAYREAAALLARAAAAGESRSRRAELNRLAARAYALIYGRAQGDRGWGTLGRALLALPAAVRSLGRFHLAAAAFLLLGFAYGFIRTGEDPEWALGWALSAGDIRTPFAEREELLRVLRHGRDGRSVPDLEKTYFAAALWQHNVRAGVTAFCLGMLGGGPALLVTYWNGVVLGVYSRIHHEKDLALAWWAWVLPHGVTELLAFVLLAGGGCAVGFSLLFPGRHTRAERLRWLRPRILPLFVCVVPMLFVAGLLESFFRQSPAEDAVRLAVAGVSLLFWGTLFALAPLPPPPAPATPAEARIPLPTADEILAAPPQRVRTASR